MEFHSDDFTQNFLHAIDKIQKNELAFLYLPLSAESYLQ